MVRNGKQDRGSAAANGPNAALPQVGGYEILEQIGKGGMGEVYVARQLTLGRLVAIKFLMPECQSDQEKDLARFRREAELMAKVSHPNVLSIFDFGEVDHRPFLVMEYVEGGDLRRRMHAGQPMSVEQVRSIVLPVGEALAYLHRHGIIHRDLKPENILLHEDDNPCVSDFGIAVLRAGAGSLTQTGQALGTLGYIAPEQQYRLKVDERVDQFSLAALTYEMLTGRRPLGIFKPPSHLNPRLPPRLDAVILRALQEDPKRRFATIQEFCDALGQSLAQTPARPRWATSRPLKWSGLCLLTIAGAVALRLVWSAQSPSSQTRFPVVDPRQTTSSETAPSASPVRSQGTSSRSSASSDSVDISSLPSQERVESPKPATPQKQIPSITEALKRLRAYKIWQERGSPTGAEGEAVKDEIWLEAVKRLQEELEQLAYQIWQERGSPTGTEGEAVKDKIWSEAQRRLFKELSGHDWAEPKSD
jgi:serine/threonine protein kinase